MEIRIQTTTEESADAMLVSSRIIKKDLSQKVVWNDNLLVNPILAFKRLKAEKYVNQIDEEGKGYIHYGQLWDFLSRFMNACGFREELRNKNIDYLQDFDIPIYENKDGVLCFRFHETILAFSKLYLEKKLGEIIEE